MIFAPRRRSAKINRDGLTAVFLRKERMFALNDKREPTMRFCPSCGAERQPGANFCHACGFGFGQAGDARKPASGAPLWTVAAVALGAAAVFVIVKFVFMGSPMSTPAVSEVGHQTDSPAELSDLEARAQGGDPAAVMDLAEAQIRLAARDEDYLFKAAQTLEGLLQRFPDHGYALRLAGNVYFNLGLAQKSVAYYQRYLALHPRDANVRVDLGTQLLALERFEEAVEQYQEALRLFPNFYNASYNLSIAYSRMGQNERAAEARNQAEDIDRQYGRLLAPQVDAPRLPSTAVSNNDATAAPSGPFASLESFFRNHPVVGPKVDDFKSEAEKAILIVRNFPMNAMPEVMLTSFEEKIRNQLNAVEADQATLEIRDAANGEVMATYKKQP